MGDSSSESQASSQSLLSRHIYRLELQQRRFRQEFEQLGLLTRTRQEEFTFLQEQVSNLEEQRRGLDQDLCQLRVLLELLSARLGQCEAQLRVAEALHSQLGQASEEHAVRNSVTSIALARLSRRVEAIERVLRANRLD